MKKYLFFLLCFSLVSAGELMAQKNYNKWIFGFHAGIDFNTNPPTPFTNSRIEGKDPPFFTSTICNKNGELLFYTDGLNVWNRFDERLPKTQNRWPWFANDLVMPLIVPYPENDTLFYILSLGKGIGNNPNYGNLVSMTVNTAANLNTAALVYPEPTTATNYYKVQASAASFLLAGTGHCNQKDYWVSTVAHGVVENYLVNKTGISTTPVTSSLPAGITQSMLDGGFSNMRFAANGEKLAIPVNRENKIILYDFNNQSGVCSNARVINLPALELLDDIEFSPAGSKLYYGSHVIEVEGPDVTGVELNNVYQLDLDAGSATAIENSRYMMNSYADRSGCSPRTCFYLDRTLQLGPDGRIYVGLRYNDKKMNIIEFPEKLKDQASYRVNLFNVGEVYFFMNINQIKSGSFSLRENGIQVRKKICLGLPTEFALLYNQIDSVKWDFGDPSSGAGNFSTSVTPAHTYAAIGLYTVKAVIYKNCLTDTAIANISIDPDPIVHIPDFIKDTVGCIGNTLYIDAKHAAATSYVWSDGLIYSYRTIDKPGQYQVKAANACSQDVRNFKVTFDDCPCDIFVPSAFTPNNDGLNDDFRPLTSCFAKEFNFQVFNKYGNVVFSTKEVGKGWNGKVKSIPAASDVFIWQLQYRNPNTNAVEKKSGTVTLLR